MPISKLLTLPYGSYLMVRLDYVLICGDELEAKILRIIEMYMDDERRAIYRDMLNNPQNEIDPNAEVDVTRDVWAAISHRLFKNDLYDQDMSENTLKRAIKSLKKKNFIRVRGTALKRYEAPKYQINTEVTQEQLHLLGKLGKTGYQKLMVSKIDGIKNSSHQNMTPSGGQNLIPSSDSMVSNFDPNSRRITDSVEEREESILPPRESAATSGAFAPTPPDVSLLEHTSSCYEDALAYLKAINGYECIDKSHTPAEVIRLAQSVREQQEAQEQAAATPSEPAHENDSHPEPPQQQTLMAPSVRESAKVEPPTPTKRRNKGLPQLTLAGQHIIDLYDASKPIKRKTRLNADNINCANSLGLAVESDDDFNRVVQRMRDDPFLKEKKVAIDLDFIDRKFEKFLTIIDQEQEAATQAEKARREAEARTKQPLPSPGLTPLTEQMRAMRARYGPKPSQPQGGN